MWYSNVVCLYSPNKFTQLVDLSGEICSTKFLIGRNVYNQNRLFIFYLNASPHFYLNDTSNPHGARVLYHYNDVVKVLGKQLSFLRYSYW